MTEIVKIPGKLTEYEAKAVGRVAANFHIGGKDETTGGKFAPNLNVSWECFSGGEKPSLGGAGEVKNKANFLENKAKLDSRPQARGLRPQTMAGG